ncbi:hypothetical protein ACFX2S_05665 [Gilliamella apicola]|uniref:hypothetical protein n=1 Tax=Gilliamella apicola TaxID=1196095 RepID=UPI0039886F84
MRNKTMINQQVIERLKLKDWYVTCQNKQESNLVLQACDDAGITWAGGEKATEWCPFETYPLDIGFYKDGKGITQDYYNLYEKEEVENITDWFFNVIKNNDGNLIPKLTPQNAEQEDLVQMLLAIMQKIPVEVNFGGEWTTSTILFPSMGYEYRIKPTPTPLPISREAWSFINKTWQYAAMDECGAICLYERKPTKSGRGWDTDFNVSDCPLNINTDGINWETSLTERPEGV